MVSVLVAVGISGGNDSGSFDSSAIPTQLRTGEFFIGANSIPGQLIMELCAFGRTGITVPSLMKGRWSQFSVVFTKVGLNRVVIVKFRYGRASSPLRQNSVPDEVSSRGLHLVVLTDIAVWQASWNHMA
ncbi:hypothetical protein BaRGS_00001035 [Batillaria attramentaria]|uniref:Uncharacterized protein n=1 Tax=Batillaria attramentaria TaxID=370345 RepID=A0ABD0M820_9CAEN